MSDQRGLSHSGETVLVTGAAGFIGSHLSESCLAQGLNVVGVDSFTDFYDPHRKAANLRAAQRHPNFRFVEGDLLQVAEEGVLTGIKQVFHLAAQAGVRPSWGEGFQSYVRQNIEVTQRLLEASRNTSVERVVIASSSSIYGDAEHLPTPEDVIPRPVSPYGMSKVAAEHLAHVYWRNYGVPIVNLRYFTVYGPRQRPDMAFNRIIDAAICDEQFTVFGDGEQTRDFTYVADIVEGTMAAGRHGIPGTTYNLGGGARYSMNQVIKQVEQIVGKPISVKFQASVRGDARDTGADTSRATDQLGFKPLFSLRQGLEAQVKWQRELQEADRSEASVR